MSTGPGNAGSHGRKHMEAKGGQRCEREDDYGAECGGPVLGTGQCGTCGLECCPDGKLCDFHFRQGLPAHMRAKEVAQ